ncbi:hypothetical protein BGX26_006035, partial [Mortierella sp. AD094]
MKSMLNLTTTALNEIKIRPETVPNGIETLPACLQLQMKSRLYLRTTDTNEIKAQP